MAIAAGFLVAAPVAMAEHHVNCHMTDNTVKEMSKEDCEKAGGKAVEHHKKEHHKKAQHHKKEHHKKEHHKAEHQQNEHHENANSDANANANGAQTEGAMSHEAQPNTPATTGTENK